MPVKITKMSKNKYKVSTPNGVKAKGASKKNTLAQERLLNAVEHSAWRPTGKKRKKKI